MNEQLALGEQLSERELCPHELLAEQEAAYARDIARLQARHTEFISVSCPACGHHATNAAFDKIGFHFDRCLTCGTLYMNPRPSEALMADYREHSENYAYWAKHIFPATEATRRIKIQQPWFERVVSYCRQYEVPMDTLIEVGPGFGTFCSVAMEAKQFKHVVAIEPAPDMAQACRERGVYVIERRLEDAADHIKGADVLVSFEVIEHLFHPRTFIDKAACLINPGGLLILSCPNGEGFDIALLGANSQSVDAEHVNLFNTKSLGDLVERSGFDLLQITTPGRLDAELVREAVLEKRYSIDDNPFLKRILIDEWQRLGWPFQQFLAQNGLSAHMWLVARRPFHST